MGQLVSSLFRRDVITVRSTTPLVSIFPHLVRENNPTVMVMVVDEQDKLVGVVTPSNLTSMKKFPWSNFKALKMVGDLADRDHPMAAAVNYARQEGLTVSDIMTSPVISVQPSDSVYHALCLLADKKKHRLPVVDKNNRVLGIFDQDMILEEACSYATVQLKIPGSDPAKCDPQLSAQDGASPTTRVHETMRRCAVVTASPDDLLVSLVPKLVRRNNPEGMVLVMNEKGKLVGVVTASDLTFMKQFGRGEFKALFLAGTLADTECPVSTAVKEAFDKSLRVKKIMTGSPVTVTETTSVHDALALLCEKRLHRLPVLNNKGEPVGVFHINAAMEVAAWHAQAEN